jgi:hypothetical protein
MAEWVTRIGRAATMGLAWALLWVPIGMVAGRLIAGDLDPEHIGGPLYAGFICGAVFSALTGLASGRCRLDELAASWAAAWGSVSGLVVGVLPFVLGDDGSYQNGWSTLIVAISACVAAIAAGRLQLGELSSLRAATLAVVASGLLSGVLPWMLNQNGIARLFPVALIAGLSALGAVSAFLSPSVARWSKKQQPASF